LKNTEIETLNFQINNENKERDSSKEYDALIIKQKMEIENLKETLKTNNEEIEKIKKESNFKLSTVTNELDELKKEINDQRHIADKE